MPGKPHTHIGPYPAFPGVSVSVCMLTGEHAETPTTAPAQLLELALLLQLLHRLLAGPGLDIGVWLRI